MENVVLIVHLLLALALIGVVLMQRSEGGGLGMGGGGGGAFSARSAGTALGRMTWILAAAFIVTSMTLTVFARIDAGGASVVDRMGDVPIETAPTGTAPVLPGLELAPSGDADAPLTPRAD